MTVLSFDIDEVPFSYAGSWLNLSRVIGMHRRADDIHLVSHVTGMHPIFSLVPTRLGQRVATEVTATPAVLRWTSADGATIEAVFSNTETVRLRGHGIDLSVTDAARELTPFTGAYFYEDPLDGAHVLTSYETGRRYRLRILSGSASTTGAGLLGAGDRSLTVTGEHWEILIDQFAASPRSTSSDPSKSFTATALRVQEEFDGYVTAIAPWRDARVPAAELAAYVMWSATVEPAGFVTRRSVLMSKHWMDKLWSWDHCFNAIALAVGGTRDGLDQFLAPFDHQDARGGLPDSITHSEVLYNFVKPPIHGWALRRLRAAAAEPLSKEDLEEVYDALSRWTDFWLHMRTAPRSVLPHYQHGNDSGWDNSTMFDHDRVVEAPDLAAFLIVQLETLADIGEELGRDDFTHWRDAAEPILEALLTDLHDEHGFFARGLTSGVRSKGSSLLPSLAIVAAGHLPDEIKGELAARIRLHLTEWGLATQLVDSAEYEADGYWRGPLWAPSTVLVEDGLRSGGYTDLADQIRSRFLRLCEQSGFAENFDATTGAGLRDRAYTWTASAYLIFARAVVGDGPSLD